MNLLAVEQPFDKRLRYVSKTYVAICKYKLLPELLKPIMAIYPNECFTIITNSIRRVLLLHGKGRDFYQKLVSLMLFLKEILGKESEAESFFNEITTTYYRLRVLKEEMTAAKLI